MRTTIDIDDQLLRRAKRHARENDTTLKAVVGEARRHTTAVSAQFASTTPSAKLWSADRNFSRFRQLKVDNPRVRKS